MRFGAHSVVDRSSAWEGESVVDAGEVLDLACEPRFAERCFEHLDLRPFNMGVELSVSNVDLALHFAENTMRRVRCVGGKTHTVE